MNIDAILFDKDGTLIDFNRTFGPATAAVIEELAAGDKGRKQALEEAAQFDPADQTIDPRSFLLAGSLYDIAAGWLAVAGRIELQGFIAEVDGLYRTHSLNYLCVFPFTEQTLKTLKHAEKALGVGTNDSEAAALEHMEKLGLTGYFDHIFGFDSGHGGKPAPGMVLAFAEATGCPPANVAMVGDTPHDCQAGRAAGAVTIAVASGNWTAEQLENHADYVLPDISHIPALIAEAKS